MMQHFNTVNLSGVEANVHTEVLGHSAGRNDQICKLVKTAQRHAGATEAH